MAHSRAKQGSFKASSSNSGKNNKKLSSNPIASRKKSTKAQQQSTSRSAKGQAGKPIPDQKPVFHNKYICCIGDITNCDGKKFDYDDIGRWVKLHAGVLQKAVDDQTTHVITSIDFYEANLKKPYEERNDMRASPPPQSRLRRHFFFSFFEFDSHINDMFFSWSKTS